MEEKNISFCIASLMDCRIISQQIGFLWMTGGKIYKPSQCHPQRIYQRLCTMKLLKPQTNGNLSERLRVKNLLLCCFKLNVYIYKGKQTLLWWSASEHLGHKHVSFLFFLSVIIGTETTGGQIHNICGCIYLIVLIILD